MIKEFLKDREPREKALLAIATILTVGLLTWQFGWVPLKSFRDRSERAFQTAITDLQIVKEATREITSRQNPSSASTPLQSVVVDAANTFGLSINRIEPDPNGGLTLWFENQNPSALYAWLRDLDNNHSVTVDKASIRRMQDSDNVSANLHVVRGQ